MRMASLRLPRMSNLFGGRGFSYLELGERVVRVQVDYRPMKCGGRFSIKAETPSLKSLVRNKGSNCKNT